MSILNINPSGERPTGVMPRNAQYVVIALIAVVILLATFWSGGKPQKKEAEAPAVAGPGASQLEGFKKALDRERRDTQAIASRQARMRQAKAQQGERQQAMTAPANQSAISVPALPDIAAELERKRAAAAPFASSLAIEEKAPAPPEAPAPDLSSQIVVLGGARVKDSAAGTSGRATLAGVVTETTKTEAQAKESGRELSPREGDLFRLYEGTVIHATLANHLDGSFTGPVNCVVATAVLAQDQKTVLIPVGSRLLGKAERVEAENQTRLAVTFKRLILPDGYSIDLEAAPGLDSGGETGLKGKVDNHNLRKFGLSGAIGLLGGLALYAGNASPYATGIGSSTGNTAANILNHALNQVPTITVPEGHPVNVYLPDDLLLPAYKAQNQIRTFR
jgi:type IV secretion system protein VirB10